MHSSCNFKPNVTYTELYVYKLKLNSDGTLGSERIDLTLNGSNNNVAVSYNPPCDRIWLSFTVSTSCYWEARVTAIDDPDYGPLIGTLARNLTSVSATETQNISIQVSPEHFPLGNIGYRIGLYAQSQLDGTWDATYLLFTNEGLKFVPTNADGDEVIIKTTV